METQLFAKQIGFLLILFLLVGNTNPSQSQVILEHHEEMQMEGLRFWYADPSKPSHIFNRNIAVHGDCFTVIN